MKKKLPKSFLLLAHVELWERFSFYSMSYLIPLYAATHIHHGGLGWTREEALRLSGIYACAAWCTPILGGYLADRVLGPKNSLYLGGILIILGHLAMLFSSLLPLFFAALLLICFGCGLFKPAITGMVGECFQGKSSSDSDNAFGFYYLAVNLGILLAGLTSGSVSESFGYNPAFALAGLGMSFGMILLFALRKGIKNIGNRIHTGSSAAAETGSVKQKKSKKGIWAAVSFSYLVSFLWFFVYFFGIGGALSLYIRDYADRTVFDFTIPVTWFPSLNPFFLIFGTFAMYWIWAHFKTKKSKEVHTVTKICFGLLASTLAFLIFQYLVLQVSPGEKTSLSLFPIIVFYLLCVIGELNVCPTAYSLISQLVPQKNASLCQAMTFVCYGLGGLAAGYMGALGLLQENAQILFPVISAILVLITLLAFLFRARLIATLNRN